MKPTLPIPGDDQSSQNQKQIIFVLGPPRSGRTTYVEHLKQLGFQVFSAHSSMVEFCTGSSNSELVRVLLLAMIRGDLFEMNTFLEITTQDLCAFNSSQQEKAVFCEYLQTAEEVTLIIPLVLKAGLNVTVVILDASDDCIKGRATVSCEDENDALFHRLEAYRQHAPGVRAALEDLLGTEKIHYSDTTSTTLCRTPFDPKLWDL